MTSKLFLIVAAVLISISGAGCAAVAAHHNALLAQHFQADAATQSAEPISGDWNVTFHVHETKTPATFALKLDGVNVSGTVYSDHTGPGTIRDGKWADGKLRFTVDFKRHESIVVTGVLQDGKLSGEFQTEGFTDKWEAVKK